MRTADLVRIHGRRAAAAAGGVRQERAGQCRLGAAGALTLSWGASANAASYEVCVDASDDGACGSTWQPAGAATTLAQSGLAAGTYYWQVRAVNVTGTTYADGGAWWSFAVVARPPLFGKLTPSNGVSGLASSVTLTWSSLADAGYMVCWDTTNNNACDGAWWPMGNAGRTLTGLANGPTTGRCGPRRRVGRSTRMTDVVRVHGRWAAAAAGGVRKSAPANGASGLPGALTLSWGRLPTPPRTRCAWTRPMTACAARPGSRLAAPRPSG